MATLAGWVAGCGNVDPGKPSEQAGAAGEVASAGNHSAGNHSAGSPSAGGESGESGGAAGSANAGHGGEGATAGGSPPHGAAGEAAGGAPDPGVAALLPWREGNSWTYRITKNGVVSEKTTLVGPEEAVGGIGPNAQLLANHVTTDKGKNDHTESWQAPSATVPGRVVRYREQAFDAGTGDLDSEVYYEPEKLHLDGSPEHSVAGATWLEKYSETTLIVNSPPSSHDVSERWTVIADDETLEVPAGTFKGVIHLQKIGSSTKNYWYARGVGKLKEAGSQTEELVEYSVAP